jgi:hypothetical protein
MNVLTELWVGMPLGSYSGTRGWSPQQIEASATALRAGGLLDGEQLTADGRRAREAIETTTDAMERPIVEALGGELDALVGRLDDWSAQCVEARAFPPDVFKRAAG